MSQRSSEDHRMGGRIVLPLRRSWLKSILKPSRIKGFISYSDNLNSMGYTKNLILLGFLIYTPISLSVANEGTAVSGNIIDIDWPDPDIHGSATLIPWVTIANTGAPTRFSVRFSIQDPKDKSYFGSCTPTEVMLHDEQRVVWPGGIQVNSAMPKGSYNAKVELYSEHCSKTDMLDVEEKDYAFNVR